MPQSGPSHSESSMTELRDKAARCDCGIDRDVNTRPRRTSSAAAQHGFPKPDARSVPNRQNPSGRSLRRSPMSQLQDEADIKVRRGDNLRPPQLRSVSRHVVLLLCWTHVLSRISYSSCSGPWFAVVDSVRPGINGHRAGYLRLQSGDPLFRNVSDRLPREDRQAGRWRRHRRGFAHGRR